MEIKENVPLAPLTTFQIGGAARWFVEVKNAEEIKAAIAFAHERGTRFLILAGCSNVLVPDEGLDALIIYVVAGEYSFSGTILEADAGSNLLKLIRAAGERGLGGWEKLAGIPGSIGGAVRGNAGAFGTEIKDFATNIHALNAETGETREFTNAECDFSYRHSFFKDHQEWIITHIITRLNLVNPEESMRLAQDTIAEREKRHLQNVKAAGSFFMNPVAPPELLAMFEQEKGVRSRENRVPAGWLIEKAGMKGACVGGACASEQHPNYIVNNGNATAMDVQTLAAKVQAEVKKQFGVNLVEEAAVL